MALTLDEMCSNANSILKHTKTDYSQLFSSVNDICAYVLDIVGCVESIEEVTSINECLLQLFGKSVLLQQRNLSYLCIPLLEIAKLLCQHNEVNPTDHCLCLALLGRCLYDTKKISAALEHLFECLDLCPYTEETESLVDVPTIICLETLADYYLTCNDALNSFNYLKWLHESITNNPQAAKSLTFLSPKTILERLSILCLECCSPASIYYAKKFHEYLCGEDSPSTCKSLFILAEAYHQHGLVDASIALYRTTIDEIECPNHEICILKATSHLLKLQENVSEKLLTDCLNIFKRMVIEELEMNMPVYKEFLLAYLRYLLHFGLYEKVLIVCDKLKICSAAHRNKLSTEIMLIQAQAHYQIGEAEKSIYLIDRALKLSFGLGYEKITGEAFFTLSLALLSSENSPERRKRGCMGMELCYERYFDELMATASRGCDSSHLERQMQTACEALFHSACDMAEYKDALVWLNDLYFLPLFSRSGWLAKNLITYRVAKLTQEQSICFERICRSVRSKFPSKDLYSCENRTVPFTNRRHLNTNPDVKPRVDITSVSLSVAITQFSKLFTHLILEALEELQPKLKELDVGASLTFVPPRELLFLDVNSLIDQSQLSESTCITSYKISTVPCLPTIYFYSSPTTTALRSSTHTCTFVPARTEKRLKPVENVGDLDYSEITSLTLNRLLIALWQSDNVSSKAPGSVEDCAISNLDNNETNRKVSIFGDPCLANHRLMVGKDTWEPKRSYQFSFTEATTVSSMLQADCFIGSEATKTNFIQCCRDCEIIHLALPMCHERGLIVFSPSKALQESSSETQPTYIQEHDYIMNADEILSLDLKGVKLVVLSACIPSDNTLKLSLISCLLASGVSSVLVLTRAVSDSYLMLFYKRFYSTLSTSVASTLTNTNDFFRNEDSFASEFPLPPFVLFGEDTTLCAEDIFHSSINRQINVLLHDTLSAPNTCEAIKSQSDISLLKLRDIILHVLDQLLKEPADVQNDMLRQMNNLIEAALSLSSCDAHNTNLSATQLETVCSFGFAKDLLEFMGFRILDSFMQVPTSSILLFPTTVANRSSLIRCWIVFHAVLELIQVEAMDLISDMMPLFVYYKDTHFERLCGLVETLLECISTDEIKSSFPEGQKTHLLQSQWTDPPVKRFLMALGFQQFQDYLVLPQPTSSSYHNIELSAWLLAALVLSDDSLNKTKKCSWANHLLEHFSKNFEFPSSPAPDLDIAKCLNNINSKSWSRFSQAQTWTTLQDTIDFYARMKRSWSKRLYKNKERLPMLDQVNALVKALSDSCGVISICRKPDSEATGKVKTEPCSKLSKMRLPLQRSTRRKPEDSHGLREFVLQA